MNGFNLFFTSCGWLVHIQEVEKIDMAPTDRYAVQN